MIKRKINVLIPNATGPSNVGDEAILHPLLKLLRESTANIEITVLTSDPLLCKKQKGVVFDENLYEWSMAESLSFYTKFSRSLQVFIAYLLLKLKLDVLIKNKELRKIIVYYKKADLIVYVGGGSLRAVKGIKNSYILLLILMIHMYANIYKTKKILTSSSFGPFSYGWQYKLVAKVIEKNDLLSFREVYSGNLFKKYSNKNFLSSSDFALFLESKKTPKRKNDFVVGFTIRNWLSEKEQAKLEKAYALALYKLLQKHTVKIQPIIQVNSPHTSQHDDLKATKRVVSNLKKYNIKASQEIIIKNLDAAIKTYGRVNLLLGMRMHSNIIAATQGVPFVAVAYEHKTKGIARDLGVEEYSIDVEQVSQKNLPALLTSAYRNRNKLSKTIEDSLAKIRRTETNKWNRVFQSYLH